MSWIGVPVRECFTGGGEDVQTRLRLTSFNEVEWILCLADSRQLLLQILTTKETVKPTGQVVE